MKKQNVRTLSFIVSTFTYLLFGAAIFDALESQTEELVKLELDRAELNYKLDYNISNQEYRELEEIIIKYHPYHIYPQWYGANLCFSNFFFMLGLNAFFSSIFCFL
jgi:potassium channel subfamily K protein 9